MIKTYKIDACHPVLKRVVKSNLSAAKANALYTELVHNKYEAIEYKIDQIIYEAGDEIWITEDMYNKLPTDNIKESIKFIFSENLNFPLTGKLIQKRINNERGALFIRWNNIPEENYLKESSICLLEEMGFKFSYPDFPYIPIKNADDEYLNEDKLIIKYLMLQNDLTEKEARKYLEVVYKAMDKTGIVFYRP